MQSQQAISDHEQKLTAAVNADFSRVTEIVRRLFPSDSLARNLFLELAENGHNEEARKLLGGASHGRREESHLELESAGEKIPDLKKAYGPRKLLGYGLLMSGGTSTLLTLSTLAFTTYMYEHAKDELNHAVNNAAAVAPMEIEEKREQLTDAKLKFYSSIIATLFTGSITSVGGYLMMQQSRYEQYYDSEIESNGKKQEQLNAIKEAQPITEGQRKFQHLVETIDTRLAQIDEDLLSLLSLRVCEAIPR